MAIDKDLLGTRVYVVGAGFSAGLGFPLTNELLALALARMRVEERDLIVRIIAFHFPYFEMDQLSSYPNIEDLLTRIKINIELFHATRSQEGNLKLNDLQEAEQHLLHTLVVLFYQIMDEMGDPEWLRNFVAHAKETAAAIVSFNWDLVLDLRLGADHPSHQISMVTAIREGRVMAKALANHRQSWTASQTKQLRELAKGNTPTRIIAMKLARTEASVRNKAGKLGVSLKPVNQAPYG